ncbi:MAG: YmdB family metallophosphoesterase [Planctomycetes bacterium]|nr:YmdB family metallophosphoesterase [Planctomycetota bacterium]
MPDETIRVLCLGDLVGRPGRRVIRECLAGVRAAHRIDFVIVNIENATNGAGVREKEAAEAAVLRHRLYDQRRPHPGLS